MSQKSKATYRIRKPEVTYLAKSKATYRIRKCEVTHATKKQSDISHQEEEVTTFGGRAVLFYNKGLSH